VAVADSLGDGGSEKRAPYRQVKDVLIGNHRLLEGGAEATNDAEMIEIGWLLLHNWLTQRNLPNSAANG